MRWEAGLTQKELARRSQIDPSWVSRIENGHDSNPRWLTLRDLAVGLEVSPTDFFARVFAFESGELPLPERQVRVRRAANDQPSAS